MKNIIVTGTSRGIGLEIALQFAKEGNKVLAVSRNIAKELESVKDVVCIQADITNEGDLAKIERYIQESWGKVDVLVNNAGAIVNKPFEEITTAEFEYVYKVNVFAVAALTRICIPFMSVGSHVVTVSSIGGIQGSVKFPGLAAYSSSKGAVIILTELLAEEFKERGISFNSVALGAVQTEMLEEAFPGYKAPLEPAEMARFLVDFALNGQRYFNGKTLQASSTTP
ncbi:SDR family NAD(P)-dependent oxidoreductase [Myroides guanonis]|uniref:Short-chain dehydrogenase n=1 Tax=Myroides guanonis TaxID=1150112 RepID=A0A1I3M9J0_9FLAO|nr:SDR family oxidoreductase [Myroides guanonis]SFI93724.1 Short-chain dehydrogenase [Myroides guanonis]